MSFAAQTLLMAGSNVMTIDELSLYHAINDQRVAQGLSALRPVVDLTTLAGQHAADFSSNVGYANWSAAPSVTARPVPTLHHWSDGSSFLDGVLSVATGLRLTLPTGLAENAEGTLVGQTNDTLLHNWLGNPATSSNLLFAGWDTMGVGISGDMTYVVFGNYDDTVQTTTPVILGTDKSDNIRTTPWADVILGGAGNDIFTAASYGDRLDGGSGADRLVLDGPAKAYQIKFVEENGEHWALINDDNGLELRIRNIEYIAFKDRVVDSSSWGERVSAVHFDADYYLASNPDVAAVLKVAYPTASKEMLAAAAADHYWSYGQKEGRDPAAFFDTSYYLAHYPDVAVAVEAGSFTAFSHYMLIGQFENRNPNAKFDAIDYLALNPDINAAIKTGEVNSAIDHYVLYGQKEKREAMFDEDYYLSAYPDVAAAINAGAFTNALSHFILYGAAEGRHGYADLI
ncbi:hypothetical protein GE253_04140 [Niveispirillum sp. SYP-B3756]|uniref:CAP domain-containing protein n=1 Tax=Niveispirillum sp. SYP-B3756 TaxID=2662178 RepID=UPI00129148D8|nr:hypothetical protein [Niveispirillum sp. SYP-B3756]MQP64530.1 hypothetical protein [Niveispirillum sp. SYP-B3756]